MASRHPTPEDREPDERDLAGKDPLEVLRAALAISPEDAKKVRDDAAAKADSRNSQRTVGDDRSKE